MGFWFYNNNSRKNKNILFFFDLKQFPISSSISEFIQTLHESSQGDSVKIKNRSYPLEYKLMIIEEAKTTNNRNVARNHGIDESSIRKWRKDELKIREALAQGKVRYRLEGAGRKPESINIQSFGGSKSWNISDHTKPPIP